MVISLNTLDLNLLRVFDALMDERSVLRAGQRIGLSQSAVSHSLARLREHLGDQLFVRTATGMQPTARALAMAALVREALLRMDLAVSSARFDATTSRRRFTLAANDYLTAVIGPHLLRAMGESAPHVDLVIRPGTRIDLAEQIDLGRIDLALGSFSNIPARLNSSLLFDYDDVLVTDRRHRFASTPFGTRELARAPLMVVSLGGQEEGAFEGFISERGLARKSEMFDRTALERAAAAAGLAPRLAIVLPHFLALPGLLADSKHVALVPRPLAALFARSGAVAIHPTPYKTRPVSVHAVWHRRYDEDSAHAWFRQILTHASATALAPRRPRARR
ncbi:MAG: LysR family transcriptional regulator [Proteobacteria bacterium]|nr:LysR family transcriptional regulator [Pseudomonadota bacterium]